MQRRCRTGRAYWMQPGSFEPKVFPVQLLWTQSPVKGFYLWVGGYALSGNPHGWVGRALYCRASWGKQIARGRWRGTLSTRAHPPNASFLREAGPFLPTPNPAVVGRDGHIDPIRPRNEGRERIRAQNPRQCGRWTRRDVETGAACLADRRASKEPDISPVDPETAGRTAGIARRWQPECASSFDFRATRRLPGWALRLPG